MKSNEKCSARYNSFLQAWLAGINNEVFFWNDFIASKGSFWPADFSRRTTSNPDFRYADFEFPVWPPKVLDVGCGPISNVGISTKKGNIELHACDPLSPIYNTILKKYNILPYCKTEFAFVEFLNNVYESNYFDMVCMENALDHSFDPVFGIYQMLNITKIGGCVKLFHNKNEAEYESYNGFHQWNISYENENLIIWNRNHRYDITSILSHMAEVKLYTVKNFRNNGSEQEQIYTSIIKHDNITLPFNPERNQLNELLLTIASWSCSSEFREICGDTIEVCGISEEESKNLRQLLPSIDQNKPVIDSTIEHDIIVNRLSIKEYVRRIMHIFLKKLSSKNY